MYEFFSDYYMFIRSSEKNISKRSREWKKSVFLQPLTDGALAQLARVSDWQSGGHGSDSRMLHETESAYESERFFLCNDLLKP